MGDDHPKACTGRRLVHRGLASEVLPPALRAPPVLLDPFAEAPLSVADRDTARRGGLFVVDCSWNRLGKRGRFPSELSRARDGVVHRRLPFLIAANPQHFGRVAELNTVEAFAAALYLVGRPDEAARLLAAFPGGDHFLTINQERLRRYAAARSGDEVRARERELFGPQGG